MARVLDRATVQCWSKDRFQKLNRSAEALWDQLLAGGERGCCESKVSLFILTNSSRAVGSSQVSFLLSLVSAGSDG
jgi:hypothetical protein